MTTSRWTLWQTEIDERLGELKLKPCQNQAECEQFARIDQVHVDRVLDVDHVVLGKDLEHKPLRIRSPKKG